MVHATPIVVNAPPVIEQESPLNTLFSGLLQGYNAYNDITRQNKLAKSEIGYRDAQTKMQQGLMDLAKKYNMTMEELLAELRKRGVKVPDGITAGQPSEPATNNVAALPTASGGTFNQVFQKALSPQSAPPTNNVGSNVNPFASALQEALIPRINQRQQAPATQNDIIRFLDAVNGGA